MLKRLAAALISSVVFGLIISVWDPFRFFGHFSWIGVWFFALYSFPVYLLGGIPLSILIEKILNQKSFHSELVFYLINLG